MASWRDAYASILASEFLAGPIEEDRLRYWTAKLLQPSNDQQIELATDSGVPIGFSCVVGPPDRRWGACVENLHVAPNARSSGEGPRISAPSRGTRWVGAGQVSAAPNVLFSAESAGPLMREADPQAGRNEDCVELIDAACLA